MTIVEVDTEHAVAAARSLTGSVGDVGSIAGDITAAGRAVDLDAWCVPIARHVEQAADRIGAVASVLHHRAELSTAADAGIVLGPASPPMLAFTAAIAQLGEPNESSHASSAAGDIADWFSGLFDAGSEHADGFIDWLAEVFEPADPADPGVAGGPHFVLGPPTRPFIHWDEDFEYDSKNPGWRDHVARAKWQAMLAGGRLLRSDLDDATQMYRHYWDNNGEPIEFDYEEAAREDLGVRNTIDIEIARAAEWAESFVEMGETDFSMTGDASVSADYPHTENWQKAIGGHQVWSSADVRVDGDTIEMTITVHGEDYYNFNRGQSDIATEASDDENGRFTELGWAQPFPSSGSVERTITWELGALDDVVITDMGEPQRNPGREDNEIERDAGDPDRTSIPDNDRDSGGTRVDG